jgi:hypothetical protein
MNLLERAMVCHLVQAVSYRRKGLILMNRKNLIALAVALTLWTLAASNAMAHGGHGGFSGGGGFHSGGFIEVALVGAFTTVDFVGAALVGAGFAAIASTIAASTIGSSSLTILTTRSSTLPIHITVTIPTATDMDSGGFRGGGFRGDSFHSRGFRHGNVRSHASRDGALRGPR